jgi:hypothetical protein
LQKSVRMSYRDMDVVPGQRFRLSPLGKQRCPKLKPDIGVVIGKSGISAVRVKFDGRKQPATLHLSYIDLE